MFIAAERNQLDAVKVLLEHPGIDVMWRDKKGCLPSKITTNPEIKRLIEQFEGRRSSSEA